MASAANYRCQKCLQVGHWTYDCTGARKYGRLFFLLYETRDQEVPCELFCLLLLVPGMCKGTAEPQWWRGRLSCQRSLPRRPRRTNPPQVRDLFFVLKMKVLYEFFFDWFILFPDSSSSDSSSDSDSDSSSSSSSSDDEDEKKEEKKKKKKKEWHSKLVPVQCTQTFATFSISVSGD